LPAALEQHEVIRIAHKRQATEIQDRDLKQEADLDHFEGRTSPDHARHVALTALAQAFLEFRRRRSRAKVLPSLDAMRRSATETVVAMRFACRERFAHIVANYARDPPIP
jgi:hypothetical protein